MIPGWILWAWQGLAGNGTRGCALRVDGGEGAPGWNPVSGCRSSEKFPEVKERMGSEGWELDHSWETPPLLLPKEMHWRCHWWDLIAHPISGKGGPLTLVKRPKPCPSYRMVCPVILQSTSSDWVWGAHCETPLVAHRVKRPPAMREAQVRSLGQEDPLEKEMATHSSTLAWKIPWMEEPGRLQSTGLQRVRHNWVTSLSLFCETLVFLPSNDTLGPKTRAASVLAAVIPSFPPTLALHFPPLLCLLPGAF